MSVNAFSGHLPNIHNHKTKESNDNNKTDFKLPNTKNNSYSKNEHTFFASQDESSADFHIGELKLPPIHSHSSDSDSISSSDNMEFLDALESILDFLDEIVANRKIVSKTFHKNVINKIEETIDHAIGENILHISISDNFFSHIDEWLTSYQDFNLKDSTWKKTMHHKVKNQRELHYKLGKKKIAKLSKILKKEIKNLNREKRFYFF